MDSTTRFSKRAEDYARYRPSYPAEAIAAILDGFTEPRLADLGAGTGISSALLADAGAHVFAIEPNAAMRSSVPSRPEIVVVDGTAESTTLPDRSVDVITAFQAYHWFDPDRVLGEAERVRPIRLSQSTGCACRKSSTRTFDHPFLRRSLSIELARRAVSVSSAM